jgi:hypothetical protein
VTALRGPLAFYEVAQTLVAAITARLTSPAATGVTRAPSRACVVPEAIVWDDCDCGGGLLAVAVNRIYYSDAFPAEASGFTAGTGGRSPCEAAYLVADMTVQVVRCAPTPQGRDLAPSCDALAGAARQVISDAYETRQAVACTLGDMEDDEISDFLVRDQPFPATSGGCMGSELRLAVGLVNGCEPC